MSPYAPDRPPSGAVFHRCALQVNPVRYGSTFRGQPRGLDERAHAEAVVRRALDLGVTVVAVTAHNDASGVSAFREAARNTGITVFPGFELETTEGIHVVLLYPPDTTVRKLERYLGEFGIRNTDPPSDLSGDSFINSLDRVRKQGGIGFAAHVVSDKGLFKVLQGKARIRAWQCEHLLAIQIPRDIDDLPERIRFIVTNRDPNYQRTYLADNGLAVAVLNAKDVVRPKDLEDPSATCWIKMSRIGIEGLRQAFLDPGSRVRLNPMEAETGTAENIELRTIAWEGGFLDGTSVPLNPNMNILVGGRGAGKSTVIESLRYVLDVLPSGTEATKLHNEIVQNVLQDGTKVSLDVISHYPSPRKYRIERTVPNPPVVRDEEGRVSNLTPENILRRLDIYGQHEISELTGNPIKLTRLLHRFVRRDPALSKCKVELRKELGENRRSLLDVEEELEHISDQISTLPALEEKLARYREAGVEERFRQRGLVVREEHILDSIPERLASLRRCLEELGQELPIDRVFLSPRALADLPGGVIIAGISEVIDRLSQEFEGTIEKLTIAVERADQSIANVRSRWEKERNRPVREEYERSLRDLQDLSGRAKDFVSIKTQIEKLRVLEDRRRHLTQMRKEHLSERRAQVAEWEDLKGREFRLLAEAAETVGNRLPDRVQVAVTVAADKEALFDVLSKDIGGRLSETRVALDRRTDFSLPEFVGTCRGGAEMLRKRYGIPSNQAARLAGAAEETLARIEELDLPPATAIRLNTAHPGESPRWQPLERLSTGQKATAVLLLLLIDSDAPLIVDQPEDDLDNSFIAEVVVPRMRESKQRRQFLFSTHNANIPVLGDAELIVGLTAEGGRARIAPQHMGAIDDPAVRVLVEDLLEGGRDAFETRRRKYGY